MDLMDCLKDWNAENDADNGGLVHKVSEGSNHSARVIYLTFWIKNTWYPVSSDSQPS